LGVCSEMQTKSPVYLAKQFKPANRGLCTKK
jgi:hypothetical protein